MPKKKTKFYEYVIKDINELIPYANNSRTHSDNQIREIASSINEWGFTNPILIDEGGGIIAGHGRVMAASKLDYEQLPCIVLSGLSEIQKKAYIIADNKLALNAGWNDEMLKLEFQDLHDADYDLNLTGFTEKERDKFLNPDDVVDGEVQFSEEVGEAHNYVVLYFNNDMDWLNAQTHFDLKTVSSKRANGKEWSKGIGRVIDGAKYIDGLKR